jgi:hypothetical protein
VRVNFLNDGTSEQACTLNITSNGARIAGLKHTPNVGDFLEVQRGAKRDVFRIVWVGEEYTDTEGQVGVVCESKNVSVWEASLLQRGFEPLPELDGGPSEQRPVAIRKPILERVSPRKAEETNYTRPILFCFAALAIFFAGFFIGRGTRPGTVAPIPAVSAQSDQRSPIDSKEAAQVRDLAQWRVATIADFDPQGIAWMKGLGLDPGGQLSFQTTGGGTGTVYVLASTDPNRALKRRLLIFVNHELHYDTSFPQIFGIAVVPAANLSQIAWQAGSRPVDVTADGVLVVRDGNDAGSGIIFETSGTRVVPRQPANFHSVLLQSQ